MASTIQALLNAIKTAVYGRDVRDAIHDSIEMCYDDVSTGRTSAEAAAASATAAAELARGKAADATTAAGLANTAAGAANDAADYANDQGDYAKAQGDYANEKAVAANTAAALANSKAGDARNAASAATTAAERAAAKADLAQAAATLADTKAGLAADAAALANTKAGLANDAAALANTKAGLANDAAALANTKAGLANDAATLANTKAGLAADAATLANTKAGLAADAATLATTKAGLAADAADAANAAAEDASDAADDANAAALLANTKANLADAATQSANSARTDALAAADLANAKAGLAATAAASASSAATDALASAANADSKATRADNAATATLAAIADAEAATSAANSAADAADAAAEDASDAADLANTKAGLANDAAALANTKAELANDAAALANTKAELANAAAAAANNAADELNNALDQVNGASEQANAAADRANTAAQAAAIAAAEASSAAKNANDVVNSIMAGEYIDLMFMSQLTGSNTSAVFADFWPASASNGDTKYRRLERFFKILADIWKTKIYTLRYYHYTVSSDSEMTPLDDLANKSPAQLCTEETVPVADWADEDPMTWYVRANALSLADGTMNILAVEGESEFDITGELAPVYTFSLALWKKEWEADDYDYKSWATVQIDSDYHYYVESADPNETGVKRTMTWHATFPGSISEKNGLTSGSGKLPLMRSGAKGSLDYARVTSPNEGLIGDCDIVWALDMWQLRHFDLSNNYICNGATLNTTSSLTPAKAETGTMRILVASSTANDRFISNLVIGENVSLGTSSTVTNLNADGFYCLPIASITEETIDNITYHCININTDTTFDVSTSMRLRIMPWKTGTTELLPNRKDGSIIDLLSRYTPYRIQGVEYGVGVIECGMDPIIHYTVEYDSELNKVEVAYNFYSVDNCNNCDGQIDGSLSNDQYYLIPEINYQTSLTPNISYDGQTIDINFPIPLGCVKYFYKTTYPVWFHKYLASTMNDDEYFKILFWCQLAGIIHSREDMVISGASSVKHSYNAASTPNGITWTDYRGNVISGTLQANASTYSANIYYAVALTDDADHYEIYRVVRDNTNPNNPVYSWSLYSDTIPRHESTVASLINRNKYVASAYRTETLGYKEYDTMKAPLGVGGGFGYGSRLGGAGKIRGKILDNYIIPPEE